jgi:hypothetical protein
VRRFASYLLLSAAMAPAAPAFAAGDGGRADAVRCAIACGHAVGSTKGAACCPTGRSSDGPTWRACPVNAGPDVPAPVKAQPAILASGFRLGPRPSSRPLEVPAATPLLRPGTSPDHVPLSLS